MAYEKLNLADGDTLKAEHLSHMEAGIEEANKAIVSVGGDTLTWDGNTEGMEVWDASAIGLGIFYKTSNATPTQSQMDDGLIAYSSGFVFPGSYCEDIGAAIMLPDATGIIIIDGGVEIEGIVLPSAGIYLTDRDGVYITGITIPGYTGFVKKRINSNYLPSPNVFFLNVAERNTTGYIYTDKNCSEKATKTQVVDALSKGVVLVKEMAVGESESIVMVFSQLACLTNDDEWGVATIPLVRGEYTTAYTAEYTPPETTSE